MVLQDDRAGKSCRERAFTKPCFSCRCVFGFASCRLEHQGRPRIGNTEKHMRKTHTLGRMLKAVGQPDAEITERTGFDHGGMFSPAFSSLPRFVKTEPLTAFRPEPVRLLSCQRRLAVQCEVKFLLRDGSNGISDRFPSFFCPAIHHVQRLSDLTIQVTPREQDRSSGL